VAFAIRPKRVDAVSWLPPEKTPIGNVERIVTSKFERDPLRANIASGDNAD
jgi:hypothetical protein